MNAAALDDPAGPFLTALARAPEGAPLAPEERDELDKIRAEMAAGYFVRHEDVPAALEEMHRAEHGDE